ncbi:MAG: head GIN domain-containing protein [Tenuifilaceae bacterium]|jgi:hypothetical protein|nr:head GIN domain-containing protein [Tenuifilaceae bacterium]
MKKSFLLQLIAVFVLLALASCGDLYNNVVVGKGELIVETRNLSDFCIIKSQIGANINIIDSDESKIEITIQENLLEHLSTTVGKGTLTITFDNTNVQTDKGIVIDIYTSTVDEFALTGAGDIYSELPISDILLTGAGTIKCVGEVSNLKATISGAGTFNFYDMPAQNATIRITGTGDVKVKAIETLDVTISGVGNVYYKGNPAVSTTITGVGNVVNSN